MGHHAEGLRLGEVAAVAASAFGSASDEEVARPRPPPPGLLLRLAARHQRSSLFKPAACSWSVSFARPRDRFIAWAQATIFLDNSRVCFGLAVGAESVGC